MLSRKRRTQILIDGSDCVLHTLAKSIQEKYPVKEIQESEEGLVMVRLRETSHRTIYNIGEVLVTEAKVMIGNTIGRGIIIGNKPVIAYELAIVDAAYNSQLPEIESWESDLLGEEKNIAIVQNKERLSVDQTRVSFETMDQPIPQDAP